LFIKGEKFDYLEVYTDSQTVLTNLGCKSTRWLLPSTFTIANYYRYSARKPILILLSHGGWKTESAWHHIKGLQPMPKSV